MILCDLFSIFLGLNQLFCPEIFLDVPFFMWVSAEFGWRSEKLPSHVTIWSNCRRQSPGKRLSKTTATMWGECVD